MRAGRSYLRGVKKALEGRKIVILLVALLLLDVGVGYFTITQTVADKPSQVHSVGSNILELEMGGRGALILTGEGVQMLSSGQLVEYQVEGRAVDITLGDDTGAAAVLKEDGTLSYFPPGKTTHSFQVQIARPASLLGVVERYTPQGHVPHGIAVLSDDGGRESLSLLSIEGDGSTDWNYSFELDVVGHDRSKNTGHIALQTEDGMVYLFRSGSDIPRMSFDAGLMGQLILSGSGTRLCVSDGSSFHLYTSTSRHPVYQVDLPPGSTGFVMQDNGERVYAKSGDRVIRIADGEWEVRWEREGLVNYTVPRVIDKGFFSTEGKIAGVKGDRSVPNWKTEPGFTATHLYTDLSGGLILAHGDDRIAVIEDRDTPLGSEVMWYSLGFLIIGEAIVLPIIQWWRELRRLRRETLTVMALGAAAGLAVLGLLPEVEMAARFGDLAYLAVGGLTAALSTLICWRADSGLANLVIGFTVGILTVIPLSLVAHFLLMVGGVGPTGFFDSIVLSLMSGLKMGLVGGAVGWLAREYFR
ncbi:MAG: hypothetical protein ACLFPN_04000 [Methanomassiliicoccales archaeon]